MPRPIHSLDRIRITTPCDAAWDSMIGNDQVRFCEHCNLQVHDLSAMTRQRAMLLVARSRERLCVRFTQRPGDSSISHVPEKLYRIGRRASRIAAGAFSATLSLSSAAAQDRSQASVPPPVPAAAVTREVTQAQQPVTAKENPGSISGVIKDPADAVIPGAQVIFLNSVLGTEETTTTSDSGEYLMQKLAPGAYKLVVSSPGFIPRVMTDINIAPGSSVRIDATLEVGMTTGGAVAVASPEEPLVKAASENDLPIVKELILSGKNVDVRDSNTFMTALDCAVENGNLEMTRTLLAAGAQANGKSDSGQTPLMYLRDSASPELVNELIAAGAKVNAKDKNEVHVLMNAALFSRVAVVKALLEAGAKPNVKDSEGNTVLMLANNNEDPEVVKLLLQQGAEVNARNDEGDTALMFAAEYGGPEIVKLLVGAGAELNVQDQSGQTALMRARDIENALELLNAGADPSIKDHKGNTALALARKYENDEKAKLLVSRGAPE